MCQCCYSVPSGRVYTRDFEPAAERPFSHSYESSLLSVWQGKGPDVRPLTHSPTHPFTHSSRNSPDFTRSLFFSPSSPHRADPPLHHRAPAGQTCAALHQPSERRLQDLHQVLLPTLFLLCVLFRLSFCNRSSSALVSAPVSSS